MTHMMCQLNGLIGFYMLFQKVVYSLVVVAIIIVLLHFRKMVMTFELVPVQ